MTNKKTILSGIIVVILNLYAFVAAGQAPLPALDEMVVLAPMPLSHQTYTIKRNSSVHQSLMEAGVDSKIIYEIVKISKPIFNLRHIQPGTRYTISRKSDEEIRRVSFEINPLTRLEVNYIDENWTSDITEVETTKKLVHFSGIVKDSLWSSAVEQQLSPEVIVDYAEVFGWQVDFNREVRVGDQWNFTVEKLFAEGRAVGWGSIVYAEYQNQDITHKAYFYANQQTKTRGYFDENGNSLRKVFLKSPLKFGRVTSGFSRRRFHPLHKRYKAHNGVDYGAPRGTPIRAIGNGRVIKVGRYGGSGNMVVLDHVAGYQTKYLHMSRFQKGVRLGSQVLQGQTIGYVGSTGFSTGPHLHFEMSKYRQMIDPLKVNLPAANPIPAHILSHYKEHIGNINRDIASVFKKSKTNLLCCNTESSKISPSQLQ